MEIISIIEQLEDMLKDAKRVPFTGKVLIDPEYLLDRLDRLRAVLPEEIEAAALVINEQERIFEEARKDARYVMDEVRTQAARMVENDEITRHAKEVSEEIVAQAESIAKEIRFGANEYADEVLTMIEKVLKNNLVAVQQGREELRGHSPKP